jgi:hypothetical protein
MIILLMLRCRKERRGYKVFGKDLCKRDDFLREVIGAIQLRCTARPHLRVRHERRLITGVTAVENDGLENGNG